MRISEDEREKQTLTCQQEIGEQPHWDNRAVIRVTENYQCKTSMIGERQKITSLFATILKRRCVSKEDMISFALIMQGISPEHLVNRMGIFFAFLRIYSTLDMVHLNMY